MSYSDLLKDPRWQRKRLEVMQRENFTCEVCKATTQTLNVHHERYVQGRKPWEYDAAELHCLCEPCHRDEHGIQTLVERKAAEAAVASAAKLEAWLVANPDYAALYRRNEELNALIPLATTDDEKNALIVEKIDTLVLMRAHPRHLRVWLSSPRGGR